MSLATHPDLRVGAVEAKWPRTMKLHNLFGVNTHLSALARRYFWTASVVTGLAIVTGLLEGFGIGMLIPLLSTFTDTAITAKGGALGLIGHIAAGHSRNERLLIVAGIILVSVVLRSALEVVTNLFAGWVDGRVGHDIRCALAENLHDVGYAFYLAEDPARLLNILSSESWKASDAVRVAMNRLSEAAAVLVFGVLLLLVSWKLSLLVAVGGLLARMVQKRAEVQLRQLSSQTVQKNQVLAERMLFTIFSARLIRLFHSQSVERQALAQASDELRHTNLQVERLSGSLGPLLEAMHAFLFLIVLIVAVLSGVTLPVLAAFLVLMNRMQPHLRALEQSGAAFAAAAAHFKEVEWLLDPSDKPILSPGDHPFHTLQEGIAFENVTFCYRDRNEPALSGASFVLRRGRATALIGNSGAGKSTVISLLCRLFEPVSGAITVDGQRLSTLRLADWLNAVAVAGQDIDLIDASIADNISYNRPGLDRAAIDAAARAAGAHFIDDLPLGLDTVVGSQGLSLSGGQRQRIGLARALARRPQFLILDEATNAVDRDTEDSIVETLQNLPEETTLLVISHRPSTLAFCDDAVVIERGRVVQTGSFASIGNLRNVSAMDSEPVGVPLRGTAASVAPGIE